MISRLREPLAAVAVVAIGLTLAFVLAAPAEASARPGSAIDQYREHIPEGGGDRPSRDVGAGDPGALSPGAEAALGSHGPIGEAVADLARRTAPGPSRGGRDGERGDRAGAGDPEPAGDGPVASIAGGLGGGASGGLGVLLPAIMLAALLAAAGFALAARRAAGGGTGDGPPRGGDGRTG